MNNNTIVEGLPVGEPVSKFRFVPVVGAFAVVAACQQSTPEQVSLVPMQAQTVIGAKERCDGFVLVASQEFFDTDIKVEVGEAIFETATKVRVPPKIELIAGTSGMSDAFVFFDEAQTGQTIACKYIPKKPGKDWSFVGCGGGPGVADRTSRRYPKQNDVVTTSRIRLRVVGVDTAPRDTEGQTSFTSGQVEFPNVDNCNQRGFDVCEAVQMTAIRTQTGRGGEVSTPILLAEPQTFVIPASLDVTSPNGAPNKNEVSLWFALLENEVARCKYVASRSGVRQYDFDGCSSDGEKKVDDSLPIGSEVVADFVDMEVGTKNFRKPAVAVVWTDTARNKNCVPVLAPDQDDDQDGIPTQQELADSRELGDSDVDNDGLENWEDTDSDGDGLADGEEAVTVVSVLAEGILGAQVSAVQTVPAYLENEDGCVPEPWFLDSDIDGFGDVNQQLDACEQPIGYVNNGADCDDTSDTIYPGAPEINCNGVDENCNNVDDGCVPEPCECVSQGEGIIVTQFQAGHGFVANSGGGSAHNVNDSTDPAFGTQSAWIETDGLGTPKTLKRVGLPAMDFSQSMPRIWVKLEGIEHIQTLQFYMGSNNFTNQYKFRWDSSQGQQWTTEGDWVGFSMSWASNHISEVGSPSRSNITDLQFRVIDKGTGGKVRLHAGQISIVPEPSEYPNGVLSFTFDDGFISQHTVAKPVMDAYGFKGTAYLIIERLNQTNYMTEAQVQNLHDDGWEIAFHSFAADTHTIAFPGLPPAQLEADFVLGRQWIYDRGYTGYNHGAYPKGAFTGSSTDVLGLVGDHFCGFRTIHQRHREAYGPSDPLKIRVFYVTKPVTVLKATQAIDRAIANKEWIILVFHEFKDPKIINGDYLPEDFQAIVDYVATTPIPVKTVGELLQPGGPPENCCIPSAEVCDGVDNNCDGNIDEGFDADGDTFTTCGTLTTDGSTVPIDCDDNPLVCGASCYPGNADPDVCDTFDQDCDGLFDEDINIAWYQDVDGDGFGDPSVEQIACDSPEGFVSDNTDCDDNPLVCGASCYPGNLDPDICDGRNQDCDEFTDEDPEINWYQDSDGDGFGDPAVEQNACEQPLGFVADNTDCDDNPANCGVHCFPGNTSPDICDTFNQDCDTFIDEDPDTIWYQDSDGDGFGNVAITHTSCIQPEGFVSDNTDCDDDLENCGTNCFPGNESPDICDGLNQDCDGATDEDANIVWYEDLDGDGFGNAGVTQMSCVPPEGFVSNDTDCDDDPDSCGTNCFPGNESPDICDGWNQDCDGATDEDPDIVWYEDLDGDGFGNAGITQMSCVPPEGFVSDNTDCDDNPDSCGMQCFPENPMGEICDGFDNDCVAGADNGVSCGSGEVYWMGFRYNMTLPELGAVKDEDIVAYEPVTDSWSMIFDGSDLGLDPYEIDGLAVLPSGDILLSFLQEASIEGLIGGPDGTKVDDSDIVLFSPSLLGDVSAGTFSFYFDGSDVGLTTDSEDVDAVGLAPDGRLLVSTAGFAEVPGVSASDDDVLLFTPLNLGASTVGTFEIYFEGGSVGIESADVDALALRSNEDLLFSTVVSFSHGSTTAEDEDILAFSSTTLGPPTSGAFSLHLDLSTLSVVPQQDLGAVHVLNTSADGDGDGHTTYSSSTGTRDDCDDSDPNRFGGNSETCDGVDNDCDGEIDEGAPCEGAGLWMAFRHNMTVPGLGAIKDEDVIAYNSTSGQWSMVFDGSDFGFAPLEIDALAVLPNGDFLLSFLQPTTIGGLVDGPDGDNVDDSDIVRFSPSSAGSNTAGTFSFYFDGSDLDLTTDSEDIDAISFTPDGKLLISTSGFFAAGGVSGSDEDLLVFTPEEIGANTVGTLELYFDGSDVGLAPYDIDAVSVRSNGDILFSTVGSFSAGGVTAEDEDIVRFSPLTTGENTTGTFALEIQLTTLGVVPENDLGALLVLD